MTETKYRMVKQRQRAPVKPSNFEPPMKSAPKSPPGMGTPLTAATNAGNAEFIPPSPELLARLQQKLDAFDRDVQTDNLYESRIGGDLKIFRNLVTRQLNSVPCNIVEVEAMTKELGIKAAFIRKRSKQNANRRGKFTEYSDALQMMPGAADALLNDKSLKAGSHFTDFAKTLKAYEDDPAEMQRNSLVAAIDSYLRNFNKLSTADAGYAAKPENQKKHSAVLKAQSQLAAQKLPGADLATKTDWTREDESKATERYLNMMLLLADAPPTNLKGAKAKELVLKVQNVREAPKLVVKPAKAEIAVPGFTAGGGAAREMMASVMADKLQEMLGIELNAAVTKVVQVDGGKLGLEPGKMVTASAQAWTKDCETCADKLKLKEKNLADPDALTPIPKEEVQNKAIFDLISMHCDRHSGNFMMDNNNKLIPIDHGNILPTKEGLVKRGAKMGPPHAFLALTPAAKEKLSPEQVERIQRLNINELMATMKEAQAEMRKSAPDADKGGVDEGLDNAKRSIEFLKYAAGELTLEQIYVAYSRSAADVFFSDEDNKLRGFARAVEFAKSYQQAADRLVTQVRTWNQKPDYEELLPQFKELGWFATLNGTQFAQWAESNPQQCLKILDDRIQYQPPEPGEPSGSVPPLPEQFLAAQRSQVPVAPTKPPELTTQEKTDAKLVKKNDQEKLRYLKNLGAHAKALKEAEPEFLVKLWQRYLELGGDAAFVRAAQDGDALVNAALTVRVQVLENMAGLADIPLA